MINYQILGEKVGLVGGDGEDCVENGDVSDVLMEQG